ncbi:MAG: DUF1631 domain-containing protein [Gammaproteobacteria bacterium]|nr:DUF1631 domain-containing protein [Gammaproteobacteria bacterium]
MVSHNNIVSFGGKGASSGYGLKTAHKNVVTACRQSMLKHLPQLMGGMFEQLDDALYELADKAETNTLQTNYFDAMRAIRKGRDRIENTFNRKVLEVFDRFCASGPTGLDQAEPRMLEAEEFSLVEEKDLEEDLALGNMVSRGENRHNQALYALDQRFGEIAGSKVDSTNNPTAPAAICGVFHSIIKGLSLDIPVKLVIYKEFEREVVDNLGPFYVEVNSLMGQAGVLPKLTRRVRRSDGGTYSPLQGGGVAGRDGDAITGNASDIRNEVYATLQELLGQRRSTTAPMYTGGAVISMPEADLSDVVSALSTLQSANTAPTTSVQDGGLGVLDIRNGLAAALRAANDGLDAKKIGNSEEDAIDVISMLFEFILEDASLPDAMKALLARLQIPMLKVAILDKAFFSRNSHPARRLLNNLAKAAIGWSESSGRSQEGVYGRIESVVKVIINDFDNDIELFTRLNDEFSDFLEHEEQGAHVIEERTAQVSKGREQLLSARQQVQDEINRRLQSQEAIPDVVVTLLKGGWKDVLQLALLRGGSESEEWQNSIAIMDQLLWSVSSIQSQEDRRKLLQSIPEILKGLRSGLNAISFNQHKMATIFKDLQVCHVSSLKGAPSSMIRTAQPVAAKVESRLEVKEKSEAEEIHDKFVDQAAALTVGSWLEVTDEGGMTFRAKLSWRSAISGTCLFVNRKGLKVAELTLQGVATWFRTKRAVVLDGVEKPLVDRALDAMVSNLKTT